MSKVKSEKKSKTPDKKTLKLYLIKVSPCCRVVWLYLLQNEIPTDTIELDVFGGEHKNPEFLSLSPHSEVPLLVDENVTVFGGVAVLRYLAAKYTDCAGWGETVEQRAQVQSVLQWASCDLHRVLGFKHVYPHFLEKYQLLSSEDTENMVDKTATTLSKCLETLESFYLREHPFLCGAELTIADTYVATVLCQGEWIDFELKMWPRVAKWFKKVKQQKHWNVVHEQHETFLRQLRKSSWNEQGD